VKPRFFLSHAVRAKEIITVLARFGFADLLDHFDLPAGIRRRLTPKSLPARTSASAWPWRTWARRRSKSASS